MYRPSALTSGRCPYNNNCSFKVTEMADKVKRSERSAYYSFILYPGDSAPENWQEILDGYHVQMLISPLHEPGKSDPEPGEPDQVESKAHRHVLVMFGSLKTQEQVAKISAAVNGTLPFPVHSKEGLARYLCHLDQPQKQQFDINDVIELGGAVYRDNIGAPYNRSTVIREMTDYVRINGIFSLADFVEYCKNENDTWYRALISDSAYIMKEYMQSAYWTMKNRLELQQMTQQAKVDAAAESLPFNDQQT